jgi:hypothetical protein
LLGPQAVVKISQALAHLPEQARRPQGRPIERLAGFAGVFRGCSYLQYVRNAATVQARSRAGHCGDPPSTGVIPHCSRLARFFRNRGSGVGAGLTDITQ